MSSFWCTVMFFSLNRLLQLYQSNKWHSLIVIRRSIADHLFPSFWIMLFVDDVLLSASKPDLWLLSVAENGEMLPSVEGRDLTPSREDCVSWYLTYEWWNKTAWGLWWWSRSLVCEWRVRLWVCALEMRACSIRIKTLVSAKHGKCGQVKLISVTVQALLCETTGSKS